MPLPRIQTKAQLRRSSPEDKADLVPPGEPPEFRESRPQPLVLSEHRRKPSAEQHRGQTRRAAIPACPRAGAEKHEESKSTKAGEIRPNVSTPAASLTSPHPSLPVLLLLLLLCQSFLVGDGAVLQPAARPRLHQIPRWQAESPVALGHAPLSPPPWAARSLL